MEHSLITINEDTDNIPKGSEGVVVYAHSNGEVYEVEFFIDNIYVIKTVLENQINIK